MLLNLSDDRALAIAEIEFDGYIELKFVPLDDKLIGLHERRDTSPTGAI